MPVGSLIAVPFLIALNAFFVAAEYAIVAIRPPQIAAMAQGRWRKSARAMTRLKENPGSAIGAVQVCITMTNLMLGWIREPAMSAVLLRLFRPLGEVIPAAVFQTGSFALSFVIVTLLTVVFSELLPKALTLRYVGVAAALTAVPVLVLGTLTRPLVWLMNAMADAVTRPLGLGRVDEIENENITIGELRALVVPGSTPLHELRRMLNHSGWGAATPVATLNGLITAHLHRIPRRGDELEIDGVRVRVRSVGRQVAAEVELEATTRVPKSGRFG